MSSDLSFMQQQSQIATDFLKKIANPNRLAILCCLHERQYNVGELAHLLNMPQAALSNQLALLREAGFIDCHSHHRERIYYLKDQRIEQIIELLHQFFCTP